MDRDTWLDLASVITEAWPDADFTPSHVDAYYEQLHDLDRDAVAGAIVACRERLAKLPPAGEIRAVALAVMGDPADLPLDGPLSPPPA